MVAYSGRSLMVEGTEGDNLVVRGPLPHPIPRPDMVQGGHLRRGFAEKQVAAHNAPDGGHAGHPAPFFGCGRLRHDGEH